MADTTGVPEPLDLRDLYLAVPAAEEEDLLEQIRSERERAWREDLVTSWLSWPCDRPKVWSMWSGSPTDDDEEDSPLEDDSDEELPRLPQVLGMLRHLLGATLIPYEVDAADRQAPPEAAPPRRASSD